MLNTQQFEHTKTRIFELLLETHIFYFLPSGLSLQNIFFKIKMDELRVGDFVGIESWQSGFRNLEGHGVERDIWHVFPVQFMNIVNEINH